MARKVFPIWVLVALGGVAAGGAQVWPVRLDPQEAAPAAPAAPSLVLADGGLEFPDGSVQTTAAAGGPPAPVPRTGQSAVYEIGDDGDLQLGVTWPNPRFTINFRTGITPPVADGTVTDNLTGLIWLRDANCFGQQTWSTALAKAAALFDGCGSCGGTNNDCGLEDGSIAGQWRLPNVRELQSLIHLGVVDPAVPDTAGTGQWSVGDPFSGVQSSFHWSSTTYADLPFGAWNVHFFSGWVQNDFKGSSHYVWPVRGGQ